MRTCVGCGRPANCDALVRLVRTPGGGLAEGRGLPGRGAWLCAGSHACLERARRRRAFERALRAPVADEAVERLRAALPGRARMDDRHTGEQNG